MAVLIPIKYLGSYGPIRNKTVRWRVRCRRTMCGILYNLYGDRALEIKTTPDPKRGHARYTEFLIGDTCVGTWWYRQAQLQGWGWGIMELPDNTQHLLLPPMPKV